MVALSGWGWILAPCLADLVEETDRLFPNRSTASDGSVGDLAHQTRESDHNPSNGYVHAVDLTDDDAHGCDITLLFAHLVASRDRRVKYLIHKGTIWKAYPNNGLPAWTPQVYTGTNSHKLHGHISVKDGEENTPGAWWPTSKPAPLIAPSGDNPMVIKRKSNPKHAVLLVDGVGFFSADGGISTTNDGPVAALDDGAFNAVVDHLKFKKTLIVTD